MLVLKLLVILFSVFIILCGLLYFWQDKLLFFPRVPVGYEDPTKNPEGLRHPGEYGIPYQNITIASTDGVNLHAWFMKQPTTEASPTLIFLQGNAGNMGFRLPNLVDLYRALKVNIVAPSYRGYGTSSGIPSERGLKDDVVAVLNHILTNADELHIDSKRIYVFGRSLGGAMAIYLAHEYPMHIKAVLLENTFLSISAMAQRILPPLSKMPWLLHLLARLEFKSDELIQHLEMPLLFISGEDDTLVPPEHMEGLFNYAKKTSLKWFVHVAEGTHNDTWQTCPQEYYLTIKSFIKAVEEKRSDGVSASTRFRLNCKAKDSSDTCVKARGPRFYEVMPRQIAHYQA